MPTRIPIRSSESSLNDPSSSHSEDGFYSHSSDIEPSESASHPPTRQHSRQRDPSHQEHRRPTPTRVHHAPTAPTSNLESSEYEAASYARGGYAPVPAPFPPRASYAPSFASQYPSHPYSNNQMIPYGPPGGFPYPPQNPMQHPFSPAPQPNATYFGGHHHQSHAGYMGGEMMPYGQNHGYGYPPGFQGPSPPVQYYGPPVVFQQIAPDASKEPSTKPSTPAPAPAAPASPVGPPPPDPALELQKKQAEMEKAMAEEKYANLQKALEDQKVEAEKWRKRIADREAAEEAAAKEAERNAKFAASTKQQVDAATSEAQKWKKIVQDREAAEKKAAEEAATRAEIERKKQEAVDAAMAEANKWRKMVEDREAAEKKAAAAAEAKKEEDKKIKEAVEIATKKALLKKEEDDRKAAEKAAAEAKEAAEKAPPPPPPPPPEEKKKPIKFKDAVGRKFSFPFHLCATWQGMEELIRQAFLHVEVIGPHVAEGHYDLVANGEIILPQVWETMIEPDLSITMHMWPMPEPKPQAPLPPDIITADPRDARQQRRRSQQPPPPPPPHVRPGGGGPPPPPPPGYIGPLDPAHHAGVQTVKDRKKKPANTFLGFGFGRPAKASAKGTKKS